MAARPCSAAICRPTCSATRRAVEATPRGHALTFYRRHGYRIVGVLPDVNGPGRPDILMAKRLIG